MAKKLISGIYKIEDIETGLVYVGSANQKSGIKKRWSNHLSKFRKNKYEYKELQEAWNIDKDRIKFEILEECTDDDLLEERENYYIKYVNMIDGWTCINKQPVATRKGEITDTSRMQKAQQGESNGHNTTLSADDVLEIKKMLSKGIRQCVIADEFGVGQPLISKIKKGTRWFCVDSDSISQDD